MFGLGQEIRVWGNTPVNQEPMPEEFRGNPDYIELEMPNPPTHHYHYSNADSQNALICQTEGFPGYINTKTHQTHSAYSDRLRGWDAERFSRVCDAIGTGDQGWAYKLPALSDTHLREIAQEAFDLQELPEHARFIHAYNVSNGGSCPIIIAISKKEDG